MTNAYTDSEMDFLRRTALAQKEMFREKYQFFSRDIAATFAQATEASHRPGFDVALFCGEILHKLNSYRSLFSSWQKRPALPGVPTEITDATKEFLTSVVEEIDGLIVKWGTVHQEHNHALAAETREAWAKKLEDEKTLSENRGERFDKLWAHKLRKFGVY